MRLIHFTTSKVWRGHEQKIIYLYEEFQHKKYTKEQWIYCPINSELYKEAKLKNFNVIPFSFKSEYDLFFAKRFKNSAEINNADLIFIHSSHAHTLAVLSSLIFNLKVPLVLCRTMIKRVDTNFFRKWKYNYKALKKIICVSQPVVDVLKFAVNDYSKLSIVGSLTDIQKFSKKTKEGILHKEFNIPPDYKIIGNISALVPLKDIETWINTVEELSRRKIKAKYILIGEGHLEKELKEIVAQKGLSDTIIFAGFRKDIPQIFPELDLFLFTSKNEATGSVILEAYASMVPSIAAKEGGTYEVLIDGETGYLAKAGNAIDFADKAEMILKSQVIQEKFKTNGYKFLLDNFTKEIIGSKMIHELESVLYQK